ncbi:trypsin-like peptidase domain-containing protein [Roseobacter sp. A03A-229]
MIRALLIASALFASPSTGLAQSDAISARSVLQIRCFPEGGETKATGFVWPEPGYMVTALHAVAGCKDGIVLSEHVGLETTIDAIVAVDLEPDLALVKLSEDFGLPALSIAGATPNVDDPHFIWGYPMAAEQMNRDSVRFSTGLSGALTTLGRAYSSADLLKLYRAQNFPTRDTQILRVASLLQHGQSGAPILDRDGRVVAIADGGLLGGWRGMNWSIPAHVYLPSLPASEDDIPQVSSRNALLMSSYAVQEPKTVHFGGPPVETASPEDRVAPAFQPIGQLSFGDVLSELKAHAPEDADWIIDELDGFIPEAAWNNFTLDVMQALGTGSWSVVPSGTDVTVDPANGFLEAVSTDGAATYAEVLFSADSFDAALEEGLEQLHSYLGTALGDGAVPDLLPEQFVDQSLEYANYDFYQETQNGKTALEFVIQANGPTFSGRVVRRDRHPNDMSDADWMDYLMMQFASYNLNDFGKASLLRTLFEQPAEDEDRYWPETSALTLVRRVPLADVAADFVADQDFGWKSDLVYLKSKLRDPSDFDKLRFDIYEDRITGATVATPEGLELEWNPTLGAIEGVASDGRLRLAIAIHQGESFDEITGDNVVQFLERLSEMAEWDELNPTNCDPEIDVEAERAECWGYFAGTDKETGSFADIYLGLTAQENVFLGTSVYILGEEEELSDQEVVAYRMMLIGAEHLSDFAVR